MKNLCYRATQHCQMILSALLVLLAVTVLANLAAAQTTAFTYQGKLTDAGNPANANYDLQFKLFDTATVGTGAQQGATLTRNPVAASAGVFTVTLDFGANVFSGADRFLEIGVRPAGSGSAYTMLAPRQPVTASPYAIQTLNAQQLGGINASEYVTTSNGGNTFVKNATTLQSGANFNISGNGIIGDSLGIGVAASAGNKLDVAGTARIALANGGVLQFYTPNSETGMTATSGTGRADLRFDGATLKLVAGLVGGPPPATNGIIIDTSGNVGIGVAASAGNKLDVAGTARIAMANGGVMQFYTPNSETGMTTTFGTGRADVRFDGTTLKLVAGLVGGPPPSTNGVVINTSGNVGIGTTIPAHRLSIGGGPFWTSNQWQGALELTNASAIGWQANTAGNRFGIGQSNGGLFFFRTASNPGTTGSPAIYDMQITDTGNITQARDKGGLVKAMIYVQQDGVILRCYNGITNSTTGNCGFVVSRLSYGDYFVDFKFQVDDRFISITPRNPVAPQTHVGASFRAVSGQPTQVEVETFITNVETNGDDAHFMIIVY